MEQIFTCNSKGPTKYIYIYIYIHLQFGIQAYSISGCCHNLRQRDYINENLVIVKRCLTLAGGLFFFFFGRSLREITDVGTRCF